MFCNDPFPTPQVMFAEDISEDFSEDRRYHFYIGFLEYFWISSRNLRGRLLSSEKFSEVFTLWVFTLKPFPVNKSSKEGPCGGGKKGSICHFALSLVLQCLGVPRYPDAGKSSTKSVVVPPLFVCPKCYPKNLLRLFFGNNLARRKITSKIKNNVARFFSCLF